MEAVRAPVARLSDLDLRGCRCRRFFILRGLKLSYYEDENDSLVRGYVIVSFASLGVLCLCVLILRAQLNEEIEVGRAEFPGVRFGFAVKCAPCLTLLAFAVCWLMTRDGHRMLRDKKYYSFYADNELMRAEWIRAISIACGLADVKPLPSVRSTTSGNSNSGSNSEKDRDKSVSFSQNASTSSSPSRSAGSGPGSGSGSAAGASSPPSRAYAGGRTSAVVVVPGASSSSARSSSRATSANASPGSGGSAEKSARNP